MVRRVKTIKIGSSAWNVVHRKFRGHIHSVFDRVFNFSSKGAIVGFADEEVGPSPINLITTLPRSEGIESLGIDEGMKVLGDGEKITIGGELVISLRGAEKWSSKTGIKEPIETKKINKNLRFAKEVVKKNFQKNRGVIQLVEFIPEILEKKSEVKTSSNKLTETILPRTERLVKAIEEKNQNKIQKRGEEIIGLGPGLTPSGDDMLAGFMLARYWVANSLDMKLERVRKENESIVEKTEGTTLLSQNLLKNASTGRANAIVGELLEDMLKGTKKDVENGIEKITRIGETSGPDTLAGIILGLESSLD